MISMSEQAAAQPDTIVNLNRVSLRYAQDSEILSDVDLILPKQSFTFITGPSGAGKSSLLKLLYLAMPPSRGLISLFGQDLSQAGEAERQIIKRRIGVVSQDFRLIPHLNVYENAVLPLRVIGQTAQQYDADAQELLKWVGLGDKLTALPRTLSGGEQQRVAIARAVMAKPDILIADEPTGNVDPDMGERLLRLFTEMNRSGTTILIATHDRGLISSLPADVYRLEDGGLVTEALAA